MANGKESSFERQVIERAWFATWDFFDSTIRSAIIFLVVSILGGGIYYSLYGWPATLEQIIPMLIFVVGPIVILWLLVFVWHFWLAPAALAYEAAKEAFAAKGSNSSSANSANTASVDWESYKRRRSYALPEFAAILAKVDPGINKHSSARESYLTLLKESLVSGGLIFSRNNSDGRVYDPEVYPEYFSVSKADAIKWAKSKGLDLSHVSGAV